ncbi:hypothetical protein chiPu_0007317 [Chiloscyllium punctatum]|uniref:Uncharacterized protein n=1 Tax=Chiloscyllium punctatum TaxID=137246 RepID=A0A401SEU5_CHIPU|nr:hypothetical protein [Chiloscyllium punctatum]
MGSVSRGSELGSGHRGRVVCGGGVVGSVSRSSLFDGGGRRGSMFGDRREVAWLAMSAEVTLLASAEVMPSSLVVERTNG